MITKHAARFGPLNVKGHIRVVRFIRPSSPVDTGVIFKWSGAGSYFKWEADLKNVKDTWLENADEVHESGLPHTGQV